MVLPGRRPSAIDHDVVEISSYKPVSQVRTADGTNSQSDSNHLCFAPRRQLHNHGSDRRHPLRAIPFGFEESGVWIGNLDDLGQRVWPFPSYTELIARAGTKNARFPVPDTVASGTRFQRSRLQCLSEDCLYDLNDPFVEHSPPSQLEMVPFENKRSVVIYPFYVRLTPQADTQRFFAIVNRQDNGQHRFWRVDGGYHESYGLMKGRSHMSGSSSHAAQSKLSGHQVPPERFSALSLVKTKRLHEDVIKGSDGDPKKLSSKKRILSVIRQPMSQLINPYLTELSEPRELNKKTPSTTPVKKPIFAAPQKPSTLPLMEICMLAYHLNGNHLRLIHHDDHFTIESDQGTLVDPVQDSCFRITEKHASYILVSKQSPCKVIMSTRKVLGIDDKEDDITGGMILLEFFEEETRNHFTSFVEQMTGGQAAKDGNNVDSAGFESVYNKMMDELGRRRADISAGRRLLAESTRQREDEEPAQCPAAAAVSNQLDVPKTPMLSRPATLPSTPVSLNSSLDYKSSMGSPPEEMPHTPLDQVHNAAALSTVSPSDEYTTPTTRNDNLTDRDAKKRELLDLLRDVYTKYPSAQDDDHVESLSLQLKAPFLLGDKDRVRKLKMELKVYLIAHHGLV